MKTVKIDMSSEAISRRLEQVEQLRRLCLSLSQSSGAEKYQKASNIPPCFQRIVIYETISATTPKEYKGG
jgi:hypothetical protein